MDEENNNSTKRGSSSRQNSLKSRQDSVNGSKSNESNSTQESLESKSQKDSEVLDDVFLKVEKTLAMIKPEAMEHQEKIEDIITENEFEILAKRTIQMTPEQAAAFYKEHFGQPYFANLVAHMSDNPVVVMCLAKENAIEEWLTIIGPTNILEAQANAPESIRAMFGSVEEDGEYYNAIHGSRDFANSLREIHFFFPKLIEEPILRGKQVHDYLQLRVNTTLLQGLEELCKEKPEEPLVWLADWLLTHNPYSPIVIASLDDYETQDMSESQRNTRAISGAKDADMNLTEEDISSLLNREMMKSKDASSMLNKGMMSDSVLDSADCIPDGGDPGNFAKEQADAAGIATRPCKCTCDCKCLNED